MAQEYDNYGIINIVNILLKKTNMNVETGPFEGFFVSSVEFCKHVKFDNIRIEKITIEIEIIEQEHKVHQVK